MSVYQSYNTKSKSIDDQLRWFIALLALPFSMFHKRITIFSRFTMLWLRTSNKNSRLFFLSFSPKAALVSTTFLDTSAFMRYTVLIFGWMLLTLSLRWCMVWLQKGNCSKFVLFLWRWLFLGALVAFPEDDLQSRDGLCPLGDWFFDGLIGQWGKFYLYSVHFGEAHFGPVIVGLEFDWLYGGGFGAGGLLYWFFLMRE